MQKNKITVIEFYRYLFMVILLAWHGNYGFMAHGYLVVEFFFILSGYFIMNSCNISSKSTAEYTINRVKRTYVKYFIALCIAFLYFGILHSIVHKTFNTNLLFNFIQEALLIQNIGIFHGNFNYPMWYFSVLIVGGHFLYYICRNHRQASVNFIIPLISLLILTFLFQQQDSIENFHTYGILYAALARGIAGMGIGIILWSLVHKSNIIKEGGGQYHSKLLDATVLISLAITLFIMYTNNCYDKYVYILFPIILFGAFTNNSFLSSILTHRIWDKLGGVTFEIFVLHATIGNAFNNILEYMHIPQNVIVFIIYTIIMTTLAFVFKSFCDSLQRKIFKHKT